MLSKYDSTLLLYELNALIKCVPPFSLSSGITPLELSYVYSPKSALYSFANLDLPQPLSIAAWAKAIEFGIISTFESISSTKSNLCLL